MHKMLIACAILVASLSGEAVFAADTDIDMQTRQQVYDQTYRNLAADPVLCEHDPGYMCGAAIPSSRVQRIFEKNYSDVVGKDPKLNDYLQWKYLSDFPDDINRDVHLRMGNVRNEGKAAVREQPSGTAFKYFCPE